MKRALIAAALLAAPAAAAEDPHRLPLAAGYKAAFLCSGRWNAGQDVASITRVYRQALDQICGPSAQALSSQPSALSPASPHSELQMAFSRGQYTGWFRGINNQELAHGRFGTKRGVLLGEILRVSGETITLRPAAPLKPGDGVVFVLLLRGMPR